MSILTHTQKTTLYFTLKVGIHKLSLVISTFVLGVFLPRAEVGALIFTCPLVIRKGIHTRSGIWDLYH